jgi:uncharacterized protein (UPF0264 family)
MRLLVSVSDGAEAREALEGGADVIDAKDPASGALGAVSLAAFAGIAQAVDRARPLTAALGEAIDPVAIEAAARAFTRAGASLVKVGLSGVADPVRQRALTAAAVRGARAAAMPSCGVVVVAYADTHDGPSSAEVIALAREAGAAGVLLDTQYKAGPGLRQYHSPAWLASWVRDAHAAGLQAMLAGRLRPDDLPALHDTGADVAGVRGAACDGGRTGRVAAANVRSLRALCSSLVSRVTP